MTPADAGAKALVDAMKTSAHPERIIEVLPQVGGPQALAALVERFDAPDIKGTAFRGLVDWRGPEASDRLLAIYAAGEPAYRDQAFNGFVRQVSSSSLPDEQRVLQVRKALGVATTARERRCAHPRDGRHEDVPGLPGRVLVTSTTPIWRTTRRTR